MRATAKQIEEDLFGTLLYGSDYQNPKASTTAMDDNKPRELPKQDLLLKILQMTTSDNPNQRLIAIDKANAMLKQYGWDWEKLIRGKITVVADPFANTPIPHSYEARPRAPHPPSRPQPPSQPAGVRTFTQSPPKRPAPPPPPPPPRGLVDSTIANQWPGDCWCCGDFTDAGKGFLFKPIDFNSHAPTTTRKLICAPCNNNPKLIVPAKKAQGKSANLADLV